MGAKWKKLSWFQRGVPVAWFNLFVSVLIWDIFGDCLDIQRRKLVAYAPGSEYIINVTLFGILISLPNGI